jgi:hypothetical protein
MTNWVVVVTGGVLAFSTSAMAVAFTNGDFEGGFTGSPPNQVGNGWTGYITGTTQLTAYTFSDEQAQVHGGNHAQRASRGTVLRNDRGVGIYQTMDANVGDAFVFEAWAWAQSNSANATLTLRLDWNGGTNPAAAGVLDTYAQAASTWTYSGRNALQVSSTNGSVTFFLDVIGAKTSNVSGLTHWDDIQVHRTQVPLALTLGNATANTIDMDVNLGGNHAGAEYAISVIGGAYGLSEGIYWVQPDGSVGTTKDNTVFMTDAAWGTKTITGLDPSTEYTLKAIARYDNDYLQETALGAGASLATLPEPAALALFSVLGGLIVMRRRPTR